MPSTAYLRRLYTLYAPVYDLAFERLMAPARRRAIARLALTDGERVLIVGGGTGQDVPHLPKGVRVTFGDVTPLMLSIARRRAARLGREVTFVELDATALPFEDESFDAVLLHLIVAVVDDPAAVVGEAARVVRVGGRVSVFDKFAPDDGPLPPLLVLFNRLSRWIATYVTRRIGPLLAGAGLERIEETGYGPGGLFRIVTATKPRPSVP